MVAFTTTTTPVNNYLSAEPLLPVCVAEDFSWRQVPVMGSCDLVHTTTFDSGDKGEEEELKVHRVGANCYV